MFFLELPGSSSDLLEAAKPIIFPFDFTFHPGRGGICGPPRPHSSPDASPCHRGETHAEDGPGARRWGGGTVGLGCLLCDMIAIIGNFIIPTDELIFFQRG